MKPQNTGFKMLQLTIMESAVTSVAFFYVIGGCLGSGIGQCRKCNRHAWRAAGSLGTCDCV